MCAAVADIEVCVPTLHRHASALLSDRRDADDLVRAALLRALEPQALESRALAQTSARRDQADIRIWLFAIMYQVLATRHWRLRLRRASRRSGPVGHEALRALDQLADQQRAVLLLVSIEDLAYGEVARILGISAASVVSLLADGREKLRRLNGAQVADAGQRRMG